jgi:hypothetical protein
LAAQRSSYGLLGLPLHAVLLLLLLWALHKAVTPCSIRRAAGCALPFLDL